MPFILPGRQTPTSIERANQGRGQRFVLGRQRGPRTIRDHRDDKRGVLRQLGTDWRHRVSKGRPPPASPSARATWG